MVGNKRPSKKLKCSVIKSSLKSGGRRGAVLVRFLARRGIAWIRALASATSGSKRLGSETRVAQARSRIEGAIERLKDAQWEVRESEARYRDLLEAQQDIIFRRDAEGRLTFANDAYHRAFAPGRGIVLGQPFAPVLKAGELPPPLAAGALRHQRFSIEVETVGGMRWFDIEEHRASADDQHESQCVGRDITEPRRQQVELAAARDAAEHANRAKSRFLAAMSHEIRTPMNGIMGMTALLKDTETTSEQKTYLTAVDRSARTLLSLIDEILDFSKIEAGRLDLDEAAFSVEDCVQSVVELLHPRAKDKGISLAWAIDPAVPRLGLGDEARLRQIVTNLVGNAVKFTDQGGVLVTVSMNDACAPSTDGRMPVVITIKDTGPGISPEAFKSLFGEFERGDETSRRQHGGTGLGLAISRRLARAMGGDITATSVPGQGAQFRALVHLKCSGARRRRIQPLLGHQHVLLALDDGFERAALRLSLEGVHVPAAECGPGEVVPVLAAAASVDAPFTIAIVDGTRPMEDISALAASVRAASRDDGATIYVILDSAPRGGFGPYARAGFDDYLVRPVRPSAVVDRVTSIGPYRRPETQTVAPRAPTASPGIKNSIRILLVEDNDINALLARRMLEKSGCTILHAKDGQKGLDAVAASVSATADAIDLVLMDVHMPVLDGLEAARRMKQLDVAPGRRLPPIIALTANAFAEDRQRCLDAGMDGYLAKPFEKDELEQVLARFVRQSDVKAA
jgi:PAS domain S-box-containing protein